MNDKDKKEFLLEIDKYHVDGLEWNFGFDGEQKLLQWVENLLESKKEGWERELINKICDRVESISDEFLESQDIKTIHDYVDVLDRIMNYLLSLKQNERQG